MENKQSKPVKVEDENMSIEKRAEEYASQFESKIQDTEDWKKVKKHYLAGANAVNKSTPVKVEQGKEAEEIQLNRIIGLCSGVIKAWEQLGSDGINVEGAIDTLIEIKGISEKILEQEYKSQSLDKAIEKNKELKQKIDRIWSLTLQDSNDPAQRLYDIQSICSKK